MVQDEQAAALKPYMEGNIEVGMPVLFVEMRDLVHHSRLLHA